jgi:hypothetical protein
VCPGAPLLVPGLAPSLASSVPELVKSCLAAVESLRTADRIVLLTSGPRSRDLGSAGGRPTLIHRPGTPVTSGLLTGRGMPAHFAGTLPLGTDPLEPISGSTPDADVMAQGVGVIVGAALLAAADVRSRTLAVELGIPSVDPEVADLVEHVTRGPERVGLLVIAEGSASRGSDSPGGGDEGAERYDRDLASALAAGDPAQLQVAVASGLGSADSLVSTGGPALSALAALTLSRPPDSAVLLYEGAPLGVGYFVTTWSWERV